MNITYSQDGSTVNIKMSGELDTPAAEEIKSTVDDIIALNPKNINVDCSSLEYIASSGLRLFIAMRKTTRANGGQINLSGVTPSVLSVFQVTSFDRIFNL